MSEPGALPKVPATCLHRPTIGGRVIPYVNIMLRDGGVDFRRRHNNRVIEVLKRRLCQVCALPLYPAPIVLLGTETALRQLLFNEPPLHPACAVYTSRACPMVAGQLAEYAHGPSVSQGARGKQCVEPGCDCGGWVDTAPPESPGVAAQPWYAVYASGYRVAYDPAGQVIGALLTPADVLRVRLVSRPGEGRCWVTVPDALASYEPPQLTPPGDVAAGFPAASSTGSTGDVP